MRVQVRAISIPRGSVGIAGFVFVVDGTFIVAVVVLELSVFTSNNHDPSACTQISKQESLMLRGRRRVTSVLTPGVWMSSERNVWCDIGIDIQSVEVECLKPAIETEGPRSPRRGDVRHAERSGGDRTDRLRGISSCNGWAIGVGIRDPPKATSDEFG